MYWQSTVSKNRSTLAAGAFTDFQFCDKSTEFFATRNGTYLAASLRYGLRRTVKAENKGEDLDWLYWELRTWLHVWWTVYWFCLKWTLVGFAIFWLKNRWLRSLSSSS